MLTAIEAGRAGLEKIQRECDDPPGQPGRRGQGRFAARRAYGGTAGRDSDHSRFLTSPARSVPEANKVLSGRGKRADGLPGTPRSCLGASGHDRAAGTCRRCSHQATIPPVGEFPLRQLVKIAQLARFLQCMTVVNPNRRVVWGSRSKACWLRWAASSHCLTSRARSASGMRLGFRFFQPNGGRSTARSMSLHFRSDYWTGSTRLISQRMPERKNRMIPRRNRDGP